MKRISSILISIVFAFTACKKEATPSETILTGTWVKGSNTGDTLQFIQKNNKNILRYNVSFNAAMPAFNEMEYKYHDEQLHVQLYSPTVQDFYLIPSFKWNLIGKEFEIRGIELFSVLSSTEVRFNYRKIQ